MAGNTYSNDGIDVASNRARLEVNFLTSNLYQLTSSVSTAESSGASVHTPDTPFRCTCAAISSRSRVARDGTYGRAFSATPTHGRDGIPLSGRQRAVYKM